MNSQEDYGSMSDLAKKMTAAKNKENGELQSVYEKIAIASCVQNETIFKGS